MGSVDSPGKSPEKREECREQTVEVRASVSTCLKRWNNIVIVQNKRKTALSGTVTAYY